MLSIGGGQSLRREGSSVQIGSNLASTVAGLLGVPKQNRRAASAAGSAAGLTPLILQDFVSSREIVDSTRKYYRQVFHHFIEKMIDLSLFVPSNPLRPNPVAALPTYQNKNEVISFLSDADIGKRVKALATEPMIQLGVEIMIHAGLRREEMTGLRSEDISADRKFLKVAKYIDPRTQKPRKLKTDWRVVPAQSRHQGEWKDLIVSPVLSTPLLPS